MFPIHVLTKTGRLQEALPFFRQAAVLTPQDPNVQPGLAQGLMQLGGAYRTEADKVYKRIIEEFQDHPAADVAVAARNKFANDNLHAAADGNIRIDAVFYMQGALDEFAVLSRKQAGKIIMELALLGQKGLQINNPDVRYSLQTKSGDFSGLQLVSIMHVGIKSLDPNAETGTGLDRDYELASSLRKLRISREICRADDYMIAKRASQAEPW